MVRRNSVFVWLKVYEETGNGHFKKTCIYLLISSFDVNSVRVYVMTVACFNRLFLIFSGISLTFLYGLSVDFDALDDWRFQMSL